MFDFLHKKSSKKTSTETAQTSLPEPIVFESKDGKVRLDVNLSDDTVWLNRLQMSELFERTVQNIGEHIRNIYKEGELDRLEVERQMVQIGKDGSRRKVLCYNLDVIISVGYRIKSTRGTQFRIWAREVLKEFLVKGYVLNQQRLQQQALYYNELQHTLRMLRSVVTQHTLSDGQSKDLLLIASDFAFALDMLDKYDRQLLEAPVLKTQSNISISYAEAIQAISRLRKQYNAGELFGKEKDDSFKSSISTIYQTFEEQDLYPSVEEKAAHLLYFVIKNHSFVDGNKRIAAFLFLWFLDKNGILYLKTGEKRITDGTLVALTLMIAESLPQEKETIIKVILNIL